MIPIFIVKGLQELEIMNRGVLERVGKVGQGKYWDFPCSLLVTVQGVKVMVAYSNRECLLFQEWISDP